MSKNLTRKGLALGAVVALGSTLFAGTAAFAAPGITVAANVGTSTNFISGETFSLKVYGNADFTTGFDNLRWEVKNASGASVTANGNGDNNDASTDATITVSPDTTVNTPGGNKLWLTVPSTTEASLVVTPYIELDGTAGRTAGDLSAGNSSTVSFKKASNVATKIAITSAYEADTKVASTFTLVDINNEQLDANWVEEDHLAVKYTYGDGTALTGATVDKLAVWDSTDKVFKTETTGTITGGLVKDAAVKAQVYYRNADNANAAAVIAGAKLGSAATSTVVARTIGSIVASGVASKTLANTSASGGFARAYVAADAAFALKVVIKDTADTAVAIPNKAVTYKVEVSTGLQATAGAVKSVTVAGTTYTDALKLPGATDVAKGAATTDANGTVTLNIATAGLTDSQFVTVTFYSENFSAAVKGIVQDASYSAYLTNAPDGEVATTDGTAAKVNVAVYDQFGNALPTGYDAVAEYDGGSQATTDSNSNSDTHSAVVDGKATLSILDNGTGLGTNYYYLTVKKRAANGAYGDTVFEFRDDLQVDIVDAADLAAGTVKLTTEGGTELGKNDAKSAYVLGSVLGGSTKASLSTDDFGSYDARAVLGTEPDLTVDGPTVYGVVTTKASATAAAVAIPSAAVTVSGAGLQFESRQTGASIWGTDSLSLYAYADGSFFVNVYSHKVGKQLVTITSGAGTSVVEVNFVASAAESAAKNIVIDSVNATQAGRAIDVTVTLTDKYGNVVDTNNADGDVLAISTKGPGYATSAIAEQTDANGQVSFKLIFSSGEVDDTVISASFDADGTGTTYKAVSTTKNISVGTTDASIDHVGKRVTAVASYSKGKTVGFYVDGIKKWSKVSTSDSDVVVNYNLKKGRHTVTVKISGGLVTSEVIIVK